MMLTEQNGSNENLNTTETKKAWNMPSITTIDIKRTMNASGTQSDGTTSQP